MPSVSHRLTETCRNGFREQIALFMRACAGVRTEYLYSIFCFEKFMLGGA